MVGIYIQYMCVCVCAYNIMCACVCVCVCLCVCICTIICHTDGFHASNKDYMTQFPIVPGHEVAGIVSKVGAEVDKLNVGDKVGVGCISESCLSCSACAEGEEHNCDNEFTETYNGPIQHGLIKTDSGYTYGGYSRKMTIHERFAIKNTVHERFDKKQMLETLYARNPICF